MQDLADLVIGNAAGMVKTLADVKKIAPSAATRITVGSITKEERSGNTGDVYYFDGRNLSSVNALGMPNPGIENYKQLLPQMLEIVEGKKLWASVAGFSPTEFAELTAACFALGADGVELNLGCPNIHDKGQSKPIFSYHPDLVADVLKEVRRLGITTQHRQKLGVKISPVPDAILDQLVRVIGESGIVSEVVAVNTLPNQHMLKGDGVEALAFLAPGDTEKKHTGGLGGRALLQEGLRVVSFLKRNLPRQIRTIGLSGIFNGADALAHLDAGASGIQCGTAYYEYGPRVFGEIFAGLDYFLETRKVRLEAVG